MVARPGLISSYRTPLAPSGSRSTRSIESTYRSSWPCKPICSLPDHLTPHKGKITIIDNYDSFTYNLSQYLGSLQCDHVVLKNDEVTLEELQELEPRAILISPGPGKPEDSGISLQAVTDFGRSLPIFGVCMGHQCIGQAFGAKIVRAPCGVMHGKASEVFHRDLGPLKGVQFHPESIITDCGMTIMENFISTV